MDYLRQITRDANIRGGQPVMKGTRVTLRTVLASLAEDAAVEDILKDSPASPRSTSGRRSPSRLRRRWKTFP